MSNNLQLLQKEIDKITHMINLDKNYFNSLTFVKKNLLNTDLNQVYEIEDCDIKKSKIIYKDKKYHYKIYLSPENFYLKDVLYLYNNNIIQDFTPKIIFIKNNKKKIIGYKHETVSTKLKKCKDKQFVDFYKGFIERMRKHHICYFDFESHNLGVTKKNRIVLIDIDLFISANLIFPNYKTIDISNVNKQWNLTLGIEKHNKIIKKYKINNYNLFTYYNQMEKKQGKKLQKRRTQQLENNFSQTEESSIIIEKDVIHVKGYQNFTISNNELINPTRKLDGVKAKLVIRIIEEHKKNCKSLIDFGCSQGYYSFLSYFNGYKVIGYEHDPSYTCNLEKIKSYFNFNSDINFINKKFGESVSSPVNGDIVLFLALIHHVYQGTDNSGSIFNIVKHLYNITNKILIIEWINKLGGHQTNNYFNCDIKDEYSKETFEKSLELFSKIEKYPSDGPNGERTIYVCFK